MNELILTVLEAVQDPAFIVSESFVFQNGNSALKDYLQISSLDELYGKRPGDILQCKSSFDHTDGCGSSWACKYCRVFSCLTQVAETGLSEHTAAEISVDQSGKFQGLAISVSVSTIQAEGQKVFFVVLKDNTLEQQKRIMERVFLHDLRNTVGGIWGVAQLLDEEELPQELKEDIVSIQKLSQNALDEIRFQAVISSAEEGTLAITPSWFHAADFIKNVMTTIPYSIEMNKVDVQQILPESELQIFADETLVRRIVLNMVLNAIEAKGSATIQIGIEKTTDKIIFWVWNDQHIPEEIQAHLFKRFYSTKGEARGIGTYSMKLLASNYLNGNIEYETSKESGTKFSLSIPAVNT